MGLEWDIELANLKDIVQKSYDSIDDVAEELKEFKKTTLRLTNKDFYGTIYEHIQKIANNREKLQLYKLFRVGLNKYERR